MKRHSLEKKKFPMPNTTQTPNVFFDSILKTLKGEAEVKIVCAVIRQTYGWWEKSFEMSLADLCEATGVARPNVQRAAIRLTNPTPDRPAILERKKKGKGQYATFAYSLIVDGTDKAFPRVYESCTPEAMNHVPPEAMNHGPSKEETNYLKPMSKKVVSQSSSQVPTMSRVEQAQDDEQKKLAQVVEWFEELSNGTRWNWHRDGKAYDQVKGYAVGFILMGICYSVGKAHDHKLATFGYCLASIRAHAENVVVSPDDALRLALRQRKRTLKCRKLGKWTVDEMTKEEFDSVMRESRAGD